MAEFTAKQKQWFDKLQVLLDDCPFDCKEIGAYTTGDDGVTIFNKAKKVTDYQFSTECGMSTAIEKLKADSIIIKFPFTVHAVSD